MVRKAGVVLLLAAFAVAGFWLYRVGWPLFIGTRVVAEEELSAETDLPLVIRVKGGMLEAASVTGRRHFGGATDPVIVGVPIPFCRERVGWYANYKITYRLRLGERWPVRFYRDQLIVRVPELEPSLPVAFDSASLVTTGREKCWFMLPMSTRERVLRRISDDLRKSANSKAAKALARESARKTVVEFVRIWAMNQTQYESISPASQIKVFFPGE